MKWDIDQNSILITFLQSRLEEAQKRITEKEYDISAQALTYQKQLEELRLKAIEDANALLVQQSIVDHSMNRSLVELKS